MTRKALLVVPENATTMEREMNALCPGLAPFLVARVTRPARTLALSDQRIKVLTRHAVSDPLVWC